MRTALAGGTLMLVTLAAAFAGYIAIQPQTPMTAAAGTAPQDQKSSVKASSATGHRKIPCKRPENASICYWTHGRLWYQSWNFTWLLWKIGTHKLLKICDEPTFLNMESTGDCWKPEFPANLQRIYDVDHRRWEQDDTSGDYYFPPEVFADFEICPLEPERAGWRQYACIESAKVTFVDN